MNKIGMPRRVPYKYGIERVQSVQKAPFDPSQEREKQNEDKKEKLLRQRTFLNELRKQQEMSKKLEENKESYEKAKVKSLN